MTKEQPYVPPPFEHWLANLDRAVFDRIENNPTELARAAFAAGQQNNPWHDVVMQECMLIGDAAYNPADPAQTVRDLIDWHIRVERLPLTEQLLAGKYPDDLEAAAKAIYEAWANDPHYRPWVTNGNTHKQNEARVIAASRMQSNKEQPF